MAFKKTEESREIELPTLIDVVFLLLIFFLATLSASAPGSKTVRPGRQADLPHLPFAEGDETVKQNEILKTLLIQISHKDKNDDSSPKVAYILKPTQGVSHTVQHVLYEAKKDSSAYREFPAEFLTMNEKQFQQCSPCSLIEAHIELYKKENFQEPSISNYIEIRAERDVEFRIVNHIMNTCSAYGDTIPRLVFRTLSETKEKEKEEQDGL